MKYLGTHTFGNPEERFNHAYERLLEVASSMDQNLVRDLASDMSDTIEPLAKLFSKELHNISAKNLKLRWFVTVVSKVIKVGQDAPNRRQDRKATSCAIWCILLLQRRGVYPVFASRHVAYL